MLLLIPAAPLCRPIARSAPARAPSAAAPTSPPRATLPIITTDTGLPSQHHSSGRATPVAAPGLAWPGLPHRCLLVTATGAAGGATRVLPQLSTASGVLPALVRRPKPRLAW